MSTDLVRFMPFRNAETNKFCHSMAVLSFVAFTLCFGAPNGFAQAPQNQRQYETQQANSVVKLRNKEGLLTPEMLQNFTAIEKPLRGFLAAGPNGPGGRNPKNMKNLQMGLQYLVLKLSDLSVQDDPRQLEISRKRLEGLITKAGSLIANPDDKKRFRQTVCETAFPFLEQLLQSNLLARSLAMEAMLTMEVVQARGGARMMMFDQVDKALLSVLKDPNQPDAVKLRAANCVKRYLAKADANPLTANTLAIAMIAELKRKFVDHVYQNTLLSALENVDAPRQLVAPRAPIVLCAAVQVLSDKTQHIRTRCRAARLAGQCAYDSQINYDPIAWKIADLTLDTALVYNGAANKKDTQWLKCGWFLFTAFQADNRAGRGQLKGILNRAPKSDVALGAYKNVLPVLRVLMTGKGGLGNAAAKLNNWNTKNQPENLVYDAKCPPVTAGGPPAGAGANADAPNG